MERLDPHEKPPDSLKTLHKIYQKASTDALAKDSSICSFSKPQDSIDCKIRPIGALEGSRLGTIFARFEGDNEAHHKLQDVDVYESLTLPGLHVLPSLLPPSTQRCLLSRLLHRDLTNPMHKTNVHFHHKVLYNGPTCTPSHGMKSPGGPQKLSFFDFAPTSSSHFPPIDSSTHNSLSVGQFLNRKLRWMTLGGQYDWTKKAYPEGSPPGFPEDIASLIQDIFPNIQPEAAIVNFYSPGDTLSIHRDVSESSDVGLVSISLGCDAIFLAGLGNAHNGESRHVVLRLKSGDAMYMSGPSRYAWHSVPRIVADTCPPYLTGWPANTGPPGLDSTIDDRFEAWRGWMAGKRINLNIRQMRD